MSLSTGTKLGPYEIIAPLGAGGMGEVYKARDTRLGRDVAVKVLPAEFASDADRLARFEREARAVAALSHPNILSIFDFGSEGTLVYAVTELLEGETLRERLSSGPLPVRKASELAAHVARGLAAAHEKGIVHRDLKPENLFVTNDGRVKILDFGLAGTMPPPDSTDTKSPTLIRATEPGALLGTVGYMSPEQVRGKAADQRSDIFSLGTVLYEMLSGQRAFQGDSQVETLNAILKEDPPDLKVGAKSAPPILDRIVRQCLEKRAEDRFQSSHDLALALQAVSGTEDEPSAAGALAPRKARRLSGTNGTLLAVLGVAALLAAGFALDFGGLRSKLLTPGPATRPIRSIAVLPLANLSGDPEQEYFADGMTDALITQLYKISGFEKVISRTSVMQYRDTRKPLPAIGRELGVEGLLEGSVQRSGDRVRITVQLIDARNDRHLWAESYDRDMRDVLNVQSEIAIAVARQVQVALTSAEVSRVGKKLTIDATTYDAYLRASDLLWSATTEPPRREAVATLERLVEQNPDFALAWARLGDGYQWLAEMGAERRSQAFPKSKSALERALALDPDMAMAHSLMAWYKHEVEWDWDGADREFRRAMELDPNNVDVLRTYMPYLLAMRRFDEAIAMGKRRVALDPLADGSTGMLARAYLVSGRFEDARVQLAAILNRNPDAFGALSLMFGCQWFLGRHEEALATLEKEAPAFKKAGEPPQGLGLLGEDYALAGRRQEALDMAKRIEALDPNRYSIGSAAASVYAILGENDKAICWLESAYERREIGLSGWYAVKQLYPESLREDPRFKAFLCKMKFPGACEGKP